MIKYPKILKVQVLNKTNLLVEFDNNEQKIYSINHLLNNPIFAPLKDFNLFKNVQIEAGGYAISWNNEIDLSEYELYTIAFPINEAV